MSRRGKGWMAWCFVMVAFATYGSIRFCEEAGIPNGAMGLLAMWVLGSSLYFFAYGVDAHDVEATRERAKWRASMGGYKGPGFPKDPFAP